MSDDWAIVIFGFPIVFFIGRLIYQIINLFYLWIKFKLENIKIKEYQLWD